MNDITLLNFTDLSLEDKKRVLSWRNNKCIRKWMHNSSYIDLDTHLSFIKSLKDVKERLYFLVKQKDTFLGVIDFTNMKNDRAEFGLYSNPNLKGVGKTLLNTICNYAFNKLNIDTLYAEVFANNTKAISLYKKFNFLEINRKIVYNKEVICMELENEDW